MFSRELYMIKAKQNKHTYGGLRKVNNELLLRCLCFSGGLLKLILIEELRLILILLEVSNTRLGI